MVFPYFIPKIAAVVSEILITNKAIMAIFSWKKYVVNAAPINTHDAPDILLFSIALVTFEKKKHIYII